MFLNDTYVKCGSARKCRRKFRRKFYDERVRSRQIIKHLVNKLRSAGQALTEEKLDDIVGQT
jgi:hypothetical protein